MSTSFSSSSSSSLSLSSTISFTSKSPLHGPCTLETVSQYSFHIVNVEVTGLRDVRPRVYSQGIWFPRPAATVVYNAKDSYYLRETKAPSFVRLPTSSFISILPKSILDNVLSSSFSALHPSFRLPPIFTHLLRHRRSNAAHKFAAKLAKLSVELARICAGEMLL